MPSTQFHSVHPPHPHGNVPIPGHLRLLLLHNHCHSPVSSGSLGGYMEDSLFSGSTQDAEFLVTENQIDFFSALALATATCLLISILGIFNFDALHCLLHLFHCVLSFLLFNRCAFHFCCYMLF